MMEPLVSIRIKEQGRVFYPGEELECEYQIDVVAKEDLHAVEASVMWYTEGKGDEDLAVHFFERRTTADADEGDLRPMRRFHTILPNSPLSYSGVILKLRWCVRVRAFLGKGREIFFEVPFQLGTIPPGQLVQRPAILEAGGDHP